MNYTASIDGSVLFIRHDHNATMAMVRLYPDYLQEKMVIVKDVDGKEEETYFVKNDDLHVRMTIDYVVHDIIDGEVPFILRERPKPNNNGITRFPPVCFTRQFVEDKLKQAVNVGEHVQQKYRLQEASYIELVASTVPSSNVVLLCPAKALRRGTVEQMDAMEKITDLYDGKYTIAETFLKM